MSLGTCTIGLYGAHSVSLWVSLCHGFFITQRLCMTTHKSNKAISSSLIIAHRHILSFWASCVCCKWWTHAALLYYGTHDSMQSAFLWSLIWLFWLSCMHVLYVCEPRVLWGRRVSKIKLHLYHNYHCSGQRKCTLAQTVCLYYSW